MRKADVNKHGVDTAEYVVVHALYQKSKGRNPSLAFCGISNPRKALAYAQSFAYFPTSGTYLEGKVPDNYKCAECGATGCKLWREYQTFLEHQRLLCAPCAAAEQDKDISDIDADGKISFERHWRTDSIGWMVPAVPTEENDTYWGYTSVPTPGVNWWKNLPSLPPPVASAKNKPQPVFDISSIDIKSAVPRWCKDQFILRASFYTGRGVNSGDLNSKYLERIYQGIKAEICEAAAINFARFVNHLKDLTASAFIQAFEEFWHNGCKDIDFRQRKGTGYEITGRSDAEKMAEGFVLIASAFGGSKATVEEIESQSRNIKAEFVREHKKEIRG